MKKVNFNLIMIACIMIFMMTIWAIDISVGALLTDSLLTNGFWMLSPMQVYHVALYGAMVTMASLAMLNIALAHKELN